MSEAKRLRLLRLEAEKASEKARTMLGLPNDIDRQEGYAAGLQHAIGIMEASPDV